MNGGPKETSNPDLHIRESMLSSFEGYLIRYNDAV